MGRAEDKHRPVECACWSRSLGWDFVLPFGVLVLLTLFLALGDRELAWHKTLYDFDNHAWTSGETPFWRFLYHTTSLPALIVVIGAAAVYVASFRSRVMGRYRRVSLYLILLVAIAPGILANLVLKEHWGRPRPREITDFGGRYAFESVLAPDPESDGKSFPCGHATMAFYFMAGWFLLRRDRRGWAYLSLLFGLGFGGLVGYMRMLQGGHFASDVLWAGAVTYFSAAALFYGMGLDRDLLPDPFVRGTGRRRIPLAVKLGGGFVALGMVASVLLATPYEAERDHVAAYDPQGDKDVKVMMSTLLGDANFIPGDTFTIRGQAFGYGVPTSGIVDRWEEEENEEVTVLRYRQRLSGWFSEIEQKLDVTVPWRRVSSFQLTAGPGKIIFDLPSLDRALTIRLDGVGNSEFEIRLEDDAVLWVPEKRRMEITRKGKGAANVIEGGERPRVNNLVTLRALERKDTQSAGEKLNIKIVTSGE